MNRFYVLRVELVMLGFLLLFPLVATAQQEDLSHLESIETNLEVMKTEVVSSSNSEVGSMENIAAEKLDAELESQIERESNESVDVSVDDEGTFSNTTDSAEFLTSGGTEEKESVIVTEPMKSPESDSTDDSVVDLADAEVEPIAEQILYREKYIANGSYAYRFTSATPKPTINLNGKTLVPNQDYSTSYSNNNKPGTATVTITGLGTYTGSITVSFQTIGDPYYDISRATISKINDVTYNPIYDYDSYEEYRPYVDSFTVTIDDNLLYSSKDYNYETKANLKTGKGTLTITGEGEYYGTKSVGFNIVSKFSDLNIRCYNKKDVIYNDDYDSESETIYSIKGENYTGRAIRPKLTIEAYEEYYDTWYDDYGDEQTSYSETARKLKEGTDYKLTYKNNVMLGTATISIIGIGVYKGTINKTFKITYPISKAVVSSIKKQTYKGKAIKPKPTVKCLGKTLKLGTDYTLSYKKNKQGGKATVVIKGKGNYSGTLNKTFKIYVPMKKVKVKKISAQCLYSKAAKPKPVVKVGSVKLKLGRDYTLKYKNNKKAGKATVTIKGKGYYKGKKSVTFIIIPRGSGSTITRTEFNKIKKGMSYKKVKYLIGGSGSLTNEYSYETTEDNSYYDDDEEEWVDDYYTSTVECKTYEWRGNGWASGASISFEDGYVTSKSQWGL